MKNYLICKPRFGRQPIYVFIDDNKCSANSLFFKHHVAVKKADIYQHPDIKYQIVFCKIRPQDKGRFLAALEELPKKMLIIGNTDYEERAEALINYLELDDEERKAAVFPPERSNK